MPGEQFRQIKYNCNVLQHFIHCSIIYNFFPISSQQNMWGEIKLCEIFAMVFKKIFNQAFYDLRVLNIKGAVTAAATAQDALSKVMMHFTLSFSSSTLY